MKVAAFALMVTVFLAGQALAGECKNIKGSAIETLVASPNDPLGRVAGPVKGSLGGAMTSFPTSIVPNVDGSLAATTVESFVTGAIDVLTFNGTFTFTPIADAPIGTVQVDGALTVSGGTGKWAGATGTLDVEGTGHDLFGPMAGPGNTYFDVRFDGRLCGL